MAGLTNSAPFQRRPRRAPLFAAISRQIIVCEYKKSGHGFACAMIALRHPCQSIFNIIKRSFMKPINKPLGSNSISVNNTDNTAIVQPDTNTRRSGQTSDPTSNPTAASAATEVQAERAANAMRPVNRPFHQAPTPTDPPRSRQRQSSPAAATTPDDPAQTSSADAPPDIRPSRRPSSRQLRMQMVHFASDVWDKIASHDLSEADLTSMSELRPGIKSALGPRLQSKRYAEQASRINSLADVRTLLQEMASLRPDLKLEPLRQLMQSLHALPLGDRATGLALFRAACSDPADPTIRHGPIEPAGLDRILHYPGAIAALSAGERVDTTLSIFNITSSPTILILEAFAARSMQPGAAGAAIRDGAHVQRVAQQFGITSSEAILQLEIIAAESIQPGSAQAAIMAGGDVQTVAQHFGITSAQGIQALVEIANRSPYDLTRDQIIPRFHQR